MARGVAAVISGSVAGLAAAKVLAAHYEQVVIFERDDLNAPGHRKGTPQSHHVHVLLAAGSAALGRQFPGLFERIEAQGGRYVDMSQFNNWFHLFHPSVAGKVLLAAMKGRGAASPRPRG